MSPTIRTFLRLLSPAALMLSACAAPTDHPPSAETVGVASSAVDPDGFMAPTRYRVEISRILVNGTYSPYMNFQTGEAGYTDFVGLGVAVGSSASDEASCSYGDAKGGATLAGCVQGSVLQNAPLFRTFTVYSPQDLVNIGIVLDNIGTTPTSAADASLQKTFATAGDITSGIGGVLAIIPGLDAAGAVLAGIGSGLSVAGDTLNPTAGQGPNCAGGLMDNPAAGHATPQDSVFYQFKASDLATLTADGPHVFGHLAAVGWNNSQCKSSQAMTITISRDWSTGDAVYAKSGDAAVVRKAGGVDAFSLGWNGSTVQHAWLEPGSSDWRDEVITAYGGPNATSFPSLNDPAMPIASVSRGPWGYDANVLFVDSTGTLYVSEMVNLAWKTIPIARGLVPSSHVTAVGRTPFDLDAFWIGTDGAVYRWSEHIANGAGPSSTTTKVTGPNMAPPGGGVAAVARTPTNVDLFFIGSDQQNSANGAMWTSSWNGQAWNTYELAYSAGYAPKGANLTATARTANNIDVFVIGNDGGLYTSYWFGGAPPYINAPVSNGQPAYATFEIPGTKGLGRAGASVSAVSRGPGFLDVAWVSNYNLELSSWTPNSGWGSGAMPGLAGSDAVAGSYNISLVAPSYEALDVVFNDVLGGLHSASWNYPAPSWTLAPTLPQAAWQGWDSVSGGLVTDPTIVAPDSTHLQVYATGPDGTVWGSAFSGTAWGTWWSLGNKGNRIVDAPSVVAVNGKVQVFVRDPVTNHLLHQEGICASSTSCSSASWNSAGWEDLGGSLAPGAPTVIVSQPNNQINVLARWTDGTARLLSGTGYNSWSMTSTVVGGTLHRFINWNNLAGVILNEPGAASWGPNRLDVMVEGSNQQLYHRYSDDNGVTWYPSNGNWEALRGSVTTTPAVVASATNRLDVFSTDSSSRINHLAWTGNSWGTCGVQPCWDYVNTGFAYPASRAVAIARGSLIDVFVQGTDRALYTSTSLGGGSFSAWTNLTSNYAYSSFFRNGGAASVVSRDGKNLDLVVTSYAANGNGSVWHDSTSGHYPNEGMVLPN